MKKQSKPMPGVSVSGSFAVSMQRQSRKTEGGLRIEVALIVMLFSVRNGVVKEISSAPPKPERLLAEEAASRRACATQVLRPAHPGVSIAEELRVGACALRKPP